MPLGGIGMVDKLPNKESVVKLIDEKIEGIKQFIKENKEAQEECEECFIERHFEGACNVHEANFWGNKGGIHFLKELRGEIVNAK